MYKIARLEPMERNALFNNTSGKMNMDAAIIEKDFWVCLVLDYLFHRSKFKDVFAFKGGTSLSKCYDLIYRFSEDIDLIIDWSIFGYEKDEPWRERSNTKQQDFNKEINTKAAQFIEEQLVPELKRELGSTINTEIQVEIDKNEPQTVLIHYPKSFSSLAISPSIRLEIGPLAAWSPSSNQQVSPYSAKAYSKAFSLPTTTVKTVSPERTFWEKITILHHEANRPHESSMPSRYSRHYYDVYCIGNSKHKNRALENLKLLEDVITFKMKFYPRNWAHYEKSKPGTIRLIPPAFRIKALEEDYKAMQEMFFGEAPTFAELIKYIALLEKDINSLAHTTA